MELFIIMTVFQAICVFRVHSCHEQEHAQETPLSRSKRLITNTKKELWTGGIVPYTFDSSLPKARRQEYLDKVFPVYEKYSCIKFVEWTNTTKKDYDLNHNSYLIFEVTNQCYSKIGRISNGGQRISCCYWATCLHEVGHALGLHHEHKSAMRNKFVRIEKQNIIDGFSSSFAMKTGLNTYNTYDSDSIMHYGLKAWSKNKKQTITFLDPDIRPFSKFANAERYFYLFMEINDAYKCTVDCTLNCENGGYVAMVNSRCRCMCPEGLDPRTGCTTLLEKDYPCGQIIELSDENPNFRLESPVLSGMKKTTTCYWFIKSPENTRILLEFPTFNINEKNGQCVDEVAVRPYLPGMRGSSYCGSVFQKTVQSDGNIIGFSFTKTKSDVDSAFVAKGSYKHESDFCYNLENGGKHYNGKVEFTVDASPCLPWHSVGHCEHSLFNIRDADKNLLKNFCRNPDNTKGPWCYTKSDGCERNYCDACNFGVCKDRVKMCNREIKNDPRYCQKNSDASKDCHETCGHCDGHQPLSSISATVCGAPTLPPDAKPQIFLDTYNVGETVTIQCNSSSDFKEVTCLSDGKWTPLNYVCGTCMPGWTNYGTNCYRFFKDELKHQGNAQNFCNKQCDGCTLLMEQKWTHDFIKDLITDNSGGCKAVWLDLTESEDAMVYTWSNGKVPDWTNWQDTCMSGWKKYGTNCYKFFKDELKQQGHAKEFCNEKCDGCTLLMEQQWTHDFIKDLIADNSGGCKPVWLDLTESEDAMVYTWSNGTVPDWTNWQDKTKPSGVGCASINSKCAWSGKKCSQQQEIVCQYTRSEPKPSGLDCAGINSQCAWSDKKCSQQQKIVCQYIRSEVEICEDQRTDCRYLLKRIPNFCQTEKKVFAESYCRKTCELC